MATRLNIIVAVFVVFFFSDFVYSEEIHTSKKNNSVSGFDLGIGSLADVCVLSYKGAQFSGSITLRTKPPCRFALDWKNDIKAYRYEDLGSATVVIVVGTPLSDKKIAQGNLKGREDCGAQIQSILIRKDEVLASEKVHDVVRCANNGIDEKEFWFLTHHDNEGIR